MSTAQRIIMAMEAGRRERQAEENRVQQQEDRKLEKEILQHRIRDIGIREKMQARALQKQNFDMTHGQPGESTNVPTDVRAALARNFATVKEAQIPASFMEGGAATTLPGARVTPQEFSVPTPGNPAQQFQHPAMDIGGVEQLGVPGISVRPQTEEQLQQKTAQAQLIKIYQEIQKKRAEADIEANTEVNLPGVGPTPKAAVPFVTADANRKAADTRAKEGRAFTAGQNALGRAASDARAAGGRAATEQRGDRNRKAADVRSANNLLHRQNAAREKEGLPPLTAPPGTEIGQLEKTPEGPGFRRWGYGGQMPQWLAVQYMQQAGGNKDGAIRMAQADGWNIEAP